MVRVTLNSIRARLTRRFRANQIIKVLKVAHAEELAKTPGEQWPLIHRQHVSEIAAVKAGKFDIIDRRTWAYPYIPESLHRLNQPILKNTPYNLRRFSETPIPRSAINLIKNSVLSLDWKVQPTKEALEENNGQITSDQAERIKFTVNSLKSPNDSDSFRDLMEAVIEDTVVGGYGTMEPRLTPDFQRPFKLWAVDGSCMSADTEVLTRRGWVFWPEVKEGDQFATRNPRTGMFEWQKAFQFFKVPWNKKLLRFRSGHGGGKDVDILCTPNHRFFGRKVRGHPGGYGSREKGKWEFLAAEDVAALKRSRDGTFGFEIPTTSVWKGKLPKGFRNGKVPIILKDGVRRKSVPGEKGFQVFADQETTYWIDLKDWVAFLGIYLAEGSASGVLGKKKQKSGAAYIGSIAAAADAEAVLRIDEARKIRLYTVSVSQKKSSRYYTEIKELLERLPFGFHEIKKGGFQTTRKGLHGLMVQMGNKYAKSVPDWVKELPKDYLEVLVEWACKGDGYTRPSSGVRTYITTSKKLADDMQELFQKIGSSASAIWSQDGSRVLFGKKYRTAPKCTVQERRREFIGVGDPEEVSYNGFVYCASVPNETLYMRRNGLPFWIANTIRIYADWSESVQEKPHYAQLTGLKGERGIISFRDDELVYVRTNVRSSTPFGLGCLEVAFNSINAFLGVQDMSTRAAADQIHKTFLWWDQGISPNQMSVVRRHVRNEIEGEGQLSLIGQIPKPEPIEIQPVTEEDLLLNWQELLIRIIAQAFNLSAMALGVERDVNRSTAEQLDESDFRRAVVPVAVTIAEAVTRKLLWRIMGWKDLEFSFVGLDDPNEMSQAQIYEVQYRNNWLVPDEIRKQYDLPELPGGWGKLTAGQYQILSMMARARESQKTPGEEPQQAGMGGGYGNLPPDLQGLDPEELQEYADAGLIPSQQSQPSQAQPQQQTQEGFLDQLTDQIQEFVQRTGKDRKKNRPKKIKNFSVYKKAQLKRFKDNEHEETREEAEARDIEKRRQYSLMKRPSKRKQGSQFTGTFPGGV